MSYVLSKLIVEALTHLGKGQEYTASGGSTTTIVCEEFGASFAEEDFEGSSIIVTEADDAAPQNEWAAIEQYDQEATTLGLYTALTAGVAAGDRFLVAGAEYPIAEMVRLANMALSDLGNIAFLSEVAISASTTRIAVDEELLSGMVDLRFKASGNDTFVPVASYEITPTAVPEINFFSPLGEGTLQIWQNIAHPELVAPSDVVSSSIHPAVASIAVAVQAHQWQMARQGTEDAAMSNLMVNLVNMMEDKKRRHKIRRAKRRSNIMNIQRLS